MTILTPIYYICTSDRRSNTLRTAVAAGNLVLSAWFMAMVGKQRKVKNNSKILETALIFHLLRAFSYFEIAIN